MQKNEGYTLNTKKKKNDEKYKKILGAYIHVSVTERVKAVA